MLSCASRVGLLTAPDSISGQPRYQRENDDVAEYLRGQMAPATLEYKWHEWVTQNATNHYGVNPLLFTVFAENPDMGDDEQAALVEAYCTPLWSLEKLRRLLSSMTSDFVKGQDLTPRSTDRLPTVIKYPKTPASIASTVKELMSGKAAITSDEAKAYDSMIKIWEPKLNLLSAAGNYHASERYHSLDRLYSMLADQISADEVDEAELQRIQGDIQAVVSSLRITDAILEQIRMGPFKTMQELIQPGVDTSLTDAERIAKGVGAIDPRQATKRNVVAAFTDGLGISTGSLDKAGRGGSNTANDPASKKQKKKTGKGPKSGTHLANKRQQAKGRTPGAVRRINAKATKRKRQDPAPQLSDSGQGTNMPRPKGPGKPKPQGGKFTKSSKKSGNGSRGGKRE